MQKLSSDFVRGIIPPIITPIDSQERIDEKKLRKQVDFVIEGGVHGILAYGSNGEFYMIDEEFERGLSIMIDQVKGRVPVYCGIGSIRTGKCIELAKKGVELGADAVSVLQPMFLKPFDEELYGHFAAIAEAIPETPMLLYNNPGRTAYTMSGDLVEKLAHTYPNIVGMKDSSGDMTQTEEFIRRNSDVGFKVLGGKDTLIFGAMCHGGAGAVATTANFIPELVVSIYEKYVAGDFEGSREAQYALNPIRLVMDKASFPVGTKDYCNLLDMDVGVPFKPNLPSEGIVLEKMRDQLKDGGFLK